MKNKFILIVAVFLLISSRANSQERFEFYRKIQVVENTGWHSLSLPDDIFSKIKRDYSDLRIFEVDGSDTVETPYVLTFARHEVQTGRVEMRPFNKGTSNGRQFVSFEVPEGQSVNSVELAFTETNIDAQVTVEGSDDRQAWFEIAKDQRIVAIFNDNADFKATTLSFPDSKYKFLRMSINSTSINLLSATFRKNSTRAGKYRIVSQHYTVREDKERKMTILEFKTDHLQPIETFSISINNEMDYYRYFSLTAVSDSSKAEKQWVYHHTPMTPGYLTSIRPNEFDFEPVWANKITLEIFNQDNAPLNIQNVTFTRPESQLIARMSQGKEYFLYYGNKSASPPTYDLVHFTDKIPESLAPLTLENEVSIGKTTATSPPLIENKVWLWLIMGVIIAVLGFFTLRMMKNK